MLYCMCTRDDLYACLPAGLSIAEVGVFKGDNAASILAAARPAELHLVDAWRAVGFGEAGIPHYISEAELSARQRYLAQAAPGWDGVDPDAALEQIYRSVQERFAAEPTVRLRRGLSRLVLPGFAEGSLDVVYVDAGHDYHDVLSDLWAAARVLKPDGLLMGHDFDDDLRQGHSGVNVIEAVTQFVKRSPFQFLAITSERGSSFCLARRNSGTAAEFARNLLASAHQMIELPDLLAGRLVRKVVRHPEGRIVRQLTSFL